MKKMLALAGALLINSMVIQADTSNLTATQQKIISLFDSQMLNEIFGNANFLKNVLPYVTLNNNVLTYNPSTGTNKVTPLSINISTCKVGTVVLGTHYFYCTDVNRNTIFGNDTTPRQPRNSNPQQIKKSSNSCLNNCVRKRGSTLKWCIMRCAADACVGSTNRRTCIDNYIKQNP